MKNNRSWKGLCRLKKRRKSNNVSRTEFGFMLVELLVALVMAMFVSLALYEGYAASLRASVVAQQQTTAAAIIQECIDESRNLTWPELQVLSGTTQNMTITGSQSTMGNTGRPLAMNTDLNYSSDGQACVFRGTCTRTVTPETGTSLRVSATVTWNQAGSTTQKTLTQSTVISQYGIHN